MQLETKDSQLALRPSESLLRLRSGRAKPVWQTVKIFSVLWLLGQNLACQSTFAEPAPVTAKANGPSVESRAAEKEKLDLRLKQIHGVANRLQQIGSQVDRNFGPSEGETSKLMAEGAKPETRSVYGIFQALVELSENLEVSFPIYQDDWVVKYASTNIPTEQVARATEAPGAKLQPGLKFPTQIASAPQCNRLDARMRLKHSNADNDLAEIGLRSCKTGDAFVTILKLEFIGRTAMKLTFDNANVRQALSLPDMSSVRAFAANCDLRSDDSGVLQNLNCNNLEWPRSLKFALIIKNLSFNSQAQDPLYFEALLYDERGILAGSVLGADPSPAQNAKPGEVAPAEPIASQEDEPADSKP